MHPDPGALGDLGDPSASDDPGHSGDPRDSGVSRAREIDVFLSGLLFYDIVFTGLEKPPTLGVEVWTKDMGSGPGGIANFAVALRRLGLRTALATAFGRDVYGEMCWETLETQEGVDLSRSARFDGWRTPVTVSLAYGDDRALVTHGHPPPISQDVLVGAPPRSRAAAVHLGDDSHGWIERAHAQGALVFGDLGWDPSEAWDPGVLEQLAYCHAFLPNAVEAMHYTRTTSPRAALGRLAELVPVVVVTCGGDGALAVDAIIGESASVRGLRVDTLDTTGAGDVFAAGFIAATLSGWPLAERLRFANLTAALSVQRPGGATAAPTWADIAQWWRSPGMGLNDRGLRRDYAFLDDRIPEDGIPENGSGREGTARDGRCVNDEHAIRRGDDFGDDRDFRDDQDFGDEHAVMDEAIQPDPIRPEGT